jgi:hypothetical protein
VIVSHKHRYLFVELPRTGSTAISKELRELYDGRQILKKHSTYTEFLKVASPDERRYFAFAAIRNPADKLVSLYFKYKYDHRDYLNPESFRGSSVFVKTLMQAQFRYVHHEGATFPQFLRKYYRLPYDDWSSFDHGRFKFIIRFETLADDFAEALRRIGVEPKRRLPLVNKTRDRDADFWSYFTPDVRRRAKWVFGPYFRRWGYRFPDDWGQDVPALSEWTNSLANVGRTFYWRHLR